jgi:hypothetical protein
MDENLQSGCSGTYHMKKHFHTDRLHFKCAQDFVNDKSDIKAMNTVEK